MNQASQDKYVFRKGFAYKMQTIDDSDRLDHRPLKLKV